MELLIFPGIHAVMRTALQQTWRIGFARPVCLSVLAFGLSSVVSWAQSGVTGEAAITLVDDGVTCGGAGRVVLVSVDITGLHGTTGPAGLNSFVITLDLSRNQAFAHAVRADDPDLDWGFLSTERSIVSTENKLSVVGWVADPDAPNQSYDVARITLAGVHGDVILMLQDRDTSLGSRVVGGSGPGPIAFRSLAPFLVNIPGDYTLELDPACSQWLQIDSTYDLALPSGPINILDLVQMTNCGS